MGRTILGVVAAYLSGLAFVVMAFSLALLAMGVEAAYQPGSYDVSVLWIVVSSVLGLLGAVLGGWVCVKVAREYEAVYWLIGLAVILGLVEFAMRAGTIPTPDARPADVDVMTAMQKSVTPLWLSGVNIVLGVVGAVIGGRLAAKNQNPR